jgi:hypothetical protein
MERLDESGDRRAGAVGGVIADLNDLIGIAAFALSHASCDAVRRSKKIECSWFSCRSAEPGWRLLPRGGARPLRLEQRNIHRAELAKVAYRSAIGVLQRSKAPSLTHRQSQP